MLVPEDDFLLGHSVSVLVVELVQELLAFVVQNAQSQVLFDDLAVGQETSGLYLLLVFVVVLLAQTFKLLLLETVEGPSFVGAVDLVSPRLGLLVQPVDLLLQVVLLTLQIVFNHVQVVFPLDLFHLYGVKLGFDVLIHLFVSLPLFFQDFLPLLKVGFFSLDGQGINVWFVAAQIPDLFQLMGPLDNRVLKTSLYLAVEVSQTLVDILGGGLEHVSLVSVGRDHLASRVGIELTEIAHRVVVPSLCLAECSF